MNWKGLERKLLWPSWDTIPTFAWKIEKNDVNPSQESRCSDSNLAPPEYTYIYIYMSFYLVTCYRVFKSIKKWLGHIHGVFGIVYLEVERRSAYLEFDLFVFIACICPLNRVRNVLPVCPTYFKGLLSHFNWYISLLLKESVMFFCVFYCISGSERCSYACGFNSLAIIVVSFRKYVQVVLFFWWWVLFDVT
jgi:hypothetical protein